VFTEPLPRNGPGIYAPVLRLHATQYAWGVFEREAVRQEPILWPQIHLFSGTAYKEVSSCLTQTIYFQENKLQIIFMRDNTLQTNSEFKFLIAMSGLL
jgi:hypothetical protein